MVHVPMWLLSAQGGRQTAILALPESREKKESVSPNFGAHHE